MTEKRRNLEKGQSLVVLAILMLVFLGMLAWVLDGGYAYFMRRNAQNAADAGALAGADIYCETEIWSNGSNGAKEIAERYAIIENNADSATASLAGERIVQVDTSITFNTFFGSILGQPAITVPASAKAGCYPPKVSEGVIPVAWSCREPTEIEDPGPGYPPPPAWDSEDCEFLYGNMDNPNLGQKYIIMDAIKLGQDMIDGCMDPTKPNDHEDNLYLIDCDLDDDGTIDLLTGGERSWLDLDGESSDAGELRDWILEPGSANIQTHVWLMGSDGGKTTVYDAALQKEGDDVILPVFNHNCAMNAEGETAGRLEDTQCFIDFSATEGGPDPKIGGNNPNVDGNNVDYFHIISFAVFHIECVSNKPSKDCPIKTIAIDQGIAEPNTFSIEGYFVRGYLPEGGGGPNNLPWLGAWTVYLIE